MKLVTDNGSRPSMESVGNTLHKLETDIIDGRLIAFACVGIDVSDNTFIYVDSVLPVSRLRLIGAMNHLLHSYEDGDEK